MFLTTIPLTMGGTVTLAADDTVNLPVLQTPLVNIVIINLIIGVLLPFLVQIITKWNAPKWVKTIVNLFCSAVAGVLSPLLGADTINWQIVVISIGQVFILSIAAHYGLYKPAGVTGPSGAIAKAVPGGIGSTKQVTAKHTGDGEKAS